MNMHSSINNTKVCSVSQTARLVKQAYMDKDISMDIHGKSVDMDMDMDEKFHIHGKPAKSWYVPYKCKYNVHLHCVNGRVVSWWAAIAGMETCLWSNTITWNPGSTRSAVTGVLPPLRLWSWRRTDRSGGQWQWWEALTKCLVSRWWWWRCDHLYKWSPYSSHSGAQSLGDKPTCWRQPFGPQTV